jgi:hypothetical protein
MVTVIGVDGCVQHLNLLLKKKIGMLCLDLQLIKIIKTLVLVIEHLQFGLVEDFTILQHILVITLIYNKILIIISI